jgi:tetratricopeptide (TPR) repeat protein
MGTALAFHCKFEEALYHFEEALGISAAAHNLGAMSAFKGQMSFWGYGLPGKIALQFQTSQEGFQMAAESGDLLAKAVACICHGMSHYSMGYFEEARELFLGADRVCIRIANASWNSLAHNGIARILMQRGQYQEAVDHFDNSVRFILEDFINPSWANLNKMGSAMGHVLSGHKSINLESLYRYCRDNKAGIYQGWIRRYLTEILLNIDDHHFSEAQHWIEEAIEADQRNGMRWHLGRDIAVYAELFKRKGLREKAKEQLGKAIEIYKECGADGWVTKAEEELATLQ